MNRFQSLIAVLAVSLALGPSARAAQANAVPAQPNPSGSSSSQASSSQAQSQTVTGEPGQGTRTSGKKAAGKGTAASTPGAHAKSTGAHQPAAKGAATAKSREQAASRQEVNGKQPPARKSSTRRVTSKGKRRLTPRQMRARIHLQPERIEEIQQALIQAGYMNGTPTGQWDDPTRSAMRRFQAEHGFPATGLPEAKSLMKLGLGPHPLPPEVDPSITAQANPNASKSDPPASPPSPPSSPTAESPRNQ